MVKHIILWQLNDDLSDIQKAGVKNGIKRGLEGLKGKIPGLLEIKVFTEPLETSNADVMLYSVFEDFASLKGYAVNPLHVDVANTKVRPYTKSRVCMDYSE